MTTRSPNLHFEAVWTTYTISGFALCDGPDRLPAKLASAQPAHTNNAQTCREPGRCEHEREPEQRCEHEHEHEHTRKSRTRTRTRTNTNKSPNTFRNEQCSDMNTFTGSNRTTNNEQRSRTREQCSLPTLTKTTISQTQRRQTS